MKKIKFLNLKFNNKEKLKQYNKIFDLFLRRGNFVLKTDTEIFEKKLCRITNNKYALGISSGTNALYLALKLAGIKTGDEVIVPCMSWYSTFTSIVKSGAIPVGIDIDDDLHLNQKLILNHITKKTKAIIYVHFSGLFKPLNNLRKICNKNKIILIEDCAQCFGTNFKKYKPGNFSDVAAYSMNPMKVFCSVGDAGAIMTNKKKYYETGKILRYAGVNIKKDECLYPELNHKIDDLHSKILSHEFKYLRKKILKRIQNAKVYDKFLTNKVIKPKIFVNFQHNYYTYTIRIKKNKRDKLIKFLQHKKIETRIQHNKLIYDHLGLKFYNFKKTIFKKGDQLKKEILSLPVNETLNEKQIIYICKTINKFKF